MEQLMSAMGQPVPKSKRILEVNPNHSILEKLRGKASENAEDPTISQYARLLHGQALLAEGGTSRQSNTGHHSNQNSGS